MIREDHLSLFEELRERRGAGKGLPFAPGILHVMAEAFGPVGLLSEKGHDLFLILEESAQTSRVDENDL
jgi:hypothetical protein